MNTKETDILNIILIIVSLALAFNVPYGLLIFSYAFLGPLHYLTEINWLKEKRYFIQETKWMWLFIALAVISTIPVILNLDVFSDFNKMPEIKKVKFFIANCFDEVFMILILFAIGLIHFKNKIHLSLFLIASIIVSILFLNYLTDYSMFVVVFVPTLIHVFLFTLLFMIYGTIKSKTTPGIIAIILLLLVPVIIMVSKINPMEYNTVTEFTKDSFRKSSFGSLNFRIAQWLAPIKPEQFGLLSVLGIKIQIFVAFAYTYHYLNWFSKTSIIRWDKSLTKSKIITILVIWLVSVSIYLYNFKVGFIVLTFLSLIHVFLEFPLNMTSIKVILEKVKSQFIR
ncbi:hypothetical protein [Flavobacterium sp.]|uniref:hypothetical protein n=1 Tax=Flavobacterium sp. TaxID=239 RepID=UPI00286D4E9F|nr:hypothetical protein [Flavobacterium sp.]